MQVGDTLSSTSLDQVSIFNMFSGELLDRTIRNPDGPEAGMLRALDEQGPKDYRDAARQAMQIAGLSGENIYDDALLRLAAGYGTTAPASDGRGPFADAPGRHGDLRPDLVSSPSARGTAINETRPGISEPSPTGFAGRTPDDPGFVGPRPILLDLNGAGIEITELWRPKGETAVGTARAIEAQAEHSARMEVKIASKNPAWAWY